MFRDFDVEDALRLEFQANDPQYDEQCANTIGHQHSDFLGHVALVDGIVVGRDC